MKITKVTSNGITKLINAYKQAMLSNDNLKFGSKQTEFFENSEISLFLSDVKGIELIALRKWCSSLIVIDKDGESFTNYPAKITNSVLRQNSNKNENDIKRESDLSILSEKIPSLHKYICKNCNIDTDSGSSVYNELFGMFDIGSYRFKVIARFEGVNIMALLNAFPEYLLFVQSKREFIEEGTKEFENLCAQQFIKNFYSYMETLLSGIDILADVRFDEEFLKYTSPYKPCICTHIRNPFVELNMSSYLSPNELVSDMKILKSDARFIQYNLDIEKDFTYHFAVEASIETLIMLLCFTNLVYYYSDLKTIIGVKSHYIVPDFLDHEMKIVYSDAFDAIDNWRLNALKELSIEEKSDVKNKIIHYSRLELYNFIPRGARIKFMLHGTKKEFKDIIDFFNTDKSLCLTNELNSIFKIISDQFPLIKTVFEMV